VQGCDLGGLQVGSPWPMQGYCPSGRNRSPVVGPSSAPVHKWQYLSGVVLAGPSVAADGTLFAAMNQNVAALDPADGGVRWTYSSGSDASSYRTMPTIAADDTLRFFDVAGGTYLILGLDAAVRSTVPTGYVSRGGITLTGDGTLYFPDNTSTLVAMEGSGSILWTTSGTSDDFIIPSVAANGTIFSATSEGTAVALSPDGGKRWDVLDAGGTYETSVAIAPDGTLRVAKQVAAGGTVYALDPSSGATLWSQKADPGPINGIAIADDGTTYVAGSSFMTAWSSTGAAAGTSTNGCLTPVVDPNGDVYALCANLLTSFDHTLGVRWQVALPNFLGDSLTPPVLAQNGFVYTSTSDAVSKGAIDAFGPP